MSSLEDPKSEAEEKEEEDEEEASVASPLTPPSIEVTCDSKCICQCHKRVHEPPCYSCIVHKTPGFPPGSHPEADAAYESQQMLSNIQVIDPSTPRVELLWVHPPVLNRSKCKTAFWKPLAVAVGFVAFLGLFFLPSHMYHVSAFLFLFFIVFVIVPISVWQYRRLSRR